MKENLLKTVASIKSEEVIESPRELLQLLRTLNESQYIEDATLLNDILVSIHVYCSK